MRHEIPTRSNRGNLSEAEVGCNVVSAVYGPTKVRLYFGDDEYEGLDPPYSFVDGVVKDGDGDVVEFVDPILVDSAVVDVNSDELSDPELQELEENGGGYLSDNDNDSDSGFLFGDV